MKIKILTLLIASVLLCNGSRAQQVVSYFAEIPQASSNWTKTVNLPGFDSSLGTLTQVKLSYGGEAWQSLYAENLSGDCTQYNLSTTATLTLGKTGDPVFFTSTPIVLNRTGHLGEYDGTTDFTGSSGVRFTQDLSLSGIYIDTDLASYVGVSSINFSATAKAISSLSSAGNIIGGASNSAAASLAIEYTYTAIPEPATYAAILGLMGLVAAAAKRRTAAYLA